MKKTMTKLFIITLFLLGSILVVIGQKKINSAPKSNPNTASIKTQRTLSSNRRRDGIVYERKINNPAARRQVESNFGKKTTKPYIGKTTAKRFETRKSEHANKLGVTKRDLSMKILSSNKDRRTVRNVEQGIIRRRGGVNNLANKINSVNAQKLAKYEKQRRSERRRNQMRRENMRSGRRVW